MQISRGIMPLALLTSGCARSHAEDGNAIAAAGAQAAGRADESGRVLWARSTVELHRICTIKQTQRQSGLVLTLPYTDGGFRRSQITGDSRGVTAADGAKVAEIAIEVTLGDDRYRFPATITSSARA
jgi:hypothetical protein